jgi:hypothetical protein
MKNKLSIVIVIVAITLLLGLPLYAADTDGDGLDDAQDNCKKVSNMDQNDSDGDGFGDACDYCVGNGAYDLDKDGLCDGEDNCPSVSNPDQKDSDKDGKGDVCINDIPKFNRLGSFEGSYRDIGQQVSHAFHDIIIDVADLFYGLNYQSAQSYYDSIEDLIPSSIKEYMEGMALGLTEVTPLSYDTAWNIVVLDSFSIELINMPASLKAHILPFADATGESPGCTGFAFSSKDGIFLGHNTDNQKGTENLGAVLYIRPTNGDNSYIHQFSPAFVDVGLALNDRGLGATFNVGRPNINADIGLPALFMLRYVMEKARTIDEAVAYFSDFIDRGNRFGTTGAIFLLVDFKKGSMAKVQVRSEKIKVTYEQELKPGVTYIATTNHYDEDFRDDPNFYYESSWKRLDRLMELLPQFETYDLNTCWEILTDHGTGPPDNNTISRDGTTSGTTVTNIFTADKVYYTLGMPHLYLETYGDPVEIDLKEMGNNCPMEDLYGKNSEEVHILRAFREKVLQNSSQGKQLIQLYYDLSPVIVQLMENNPETKRRIKRTIDSILPVIKDRAE